MLRLILANWVQTMTMSVPQGRVLKSKEGGLWSQMNQPWPLRGCLCCLSTVPQCLFNGLRKNKAPGFRGSDQGKSYGLSLNGTGRGIFHCTCTSGSSQASHSGPNIRQMKGSSSGKYNLLKLVLEKRTGVFWLRNRCLFRTYICLSSYQFLASQPIYAFSPPCCPVQNSSDEGKCFLVT